MNQMLVEEKICNDDKKLYNFKKIPIAELENYYISEKGVIYNIVKNRYYLSFNHKRNKHYAFKINNSQYQIKHLLYITFINNTIDINDLRNVKSKYMINIKNTNDNLPYINFTINDLELITKSDKVRLQPRNNRIINKYNSNKQFIKSYTHIRDIKKELNVKYSKHIVNACKSKKDKLYNKYYFRYNDDDEIKNNNINNNINNNDGLNNFYSYLNNIYTHDLDIFEV